mgnify:CR=1 FL=1
MKLLPMLAELRDGAPFGGAGWMWEPKLDGYRVLAFIDDKEVKLRSRRGLDLTASFPKLAAELALQAVKGMVLDGEVAAFGADGRPSFAALQERVQLKTEREIAQADRATPVGLLLLRPAALRRPRRARRALRRPQALARAVPAALAPCSAGACGGRRRRALQGGARERLRGRDRQAQGQQIRSRQALAGLAQDQADEERRVRRRRVHQGQEARGRSLGALLLGYWDDGKLHYCGHVGSGFDDRTLAQVKARAKSSKTNDPAPSPRSPSCTARRPG